MNILVMENCNVKGSDIKNALGNSNIPIKTFTSLPEILTHIHHSDDPFILISEIISTAELEMSKMYDTLQLPHFKGLVFLSKYSEEVIDTTRHIANDMGLSNVIGISLPASLEAIRDKVHQALEHQVSYSSGYVFDDQLSISDVLYALDNDLFVPYYQPQFCTKSEKLSGFEILARANIDGTIYTPNHFIDKLVVAKRITDFTYNILDKAILDIRKLIGFNGSISLNVDYYSLSEPSFGDNILNILSRRGFPPHRLTIEVTEEQPLINIRVMRNLALLRMRNCSVSVDDFGMKHSGFTELFKLPFSEIKIDQSFIREMTHSTRAFNIVKALSAVAQSLGYTTVAEGVETQAQREMLKSLDIDYVQGYLYSKPVPIDELGTFVL